MQTIDPRLIDKVATAIMKMSKERGHPVSELVVGHLAAAAIMVMYEQEPQISGFR